MSESRTFKIVKPHMKGSDVKAWQEFVVDRFDKWNIDYPLKLDGDYGATTRSATASLMRAWGVASAQDAMERGLTPQWRTKIRHDDRTRAELGHFHSDSRIEYRKALRERFRHTSLSTPTPVITEHSWGWHPPGHDGVDLIAPFNNPMLAICDGRVVRADADGWWGKGAQPSAGHPIGDGDGIIIIECGVDVGIFEKGMHFCYGHGEHAAVEEGQLVKAGQPVGRVGWANIGHIHFMVNKIKPVAGFYTGRGDRDPWPFVAYAIKHS